MFVIRNLLVGVSFMFLFTACSRNVNTASYVFSGVSGSRVDLVEQNVKEIENMQQDRFLHSSSPDMQITFKFGELDEETIGEALIEVGKCQITLAPELDPANSDRMFFDYAKKRLMVVVAHEVGHCFGLDHVEQEGEVMSPYFDYDATRPEALARYNQALTIERSN